MSKRSFLDIDYTDLPNEFEFDEGTAHFYGDIFYNRTHDYYWLDLYDEDHIAIIMGEKLVYNQPLWSDFNDPRLPMLDYIPMDESLTEGHIGIDNFGDPVKIYIGDFSSSLEADGSGGEEDINPDGDIESSTDISDSEDDAVEDESIVDFTEDDSENEDLYDGADLQESTSDDPDQSGDDG